MKKFVWSGGHTEPVLTLDHSKEEVLASGGEDGIVSLWSSDGVSQAKFSVAFDDCSDVSCVCFCNKEPKHLYVSCGKKIFLFDTRNVSKAMWEIEQNKDEINQITLNDKSNFLAAGDDSGEIQIFELPCAKLFKTLSRRHTALCCCVQFRPKRPWELVSGGMDYNIFNWDFSSGRSVCQISAQELGATEETGTGNSYNVNPPFVNSIHMAPNSRAFACGLGDGSIGLFQFEGKKKFCHNYSLKFHSQGVSQVHFPRFQPNELLLSGGNDCKIVLWHQKDEKKVHNETESSAGASQGFHPMTAVHKENHGDKVNWLCSSNLSKKLIFVADNTNNISVYETEY